nr:MAG TPA: hypothetical protein [Caudoviricetes sp.]
MSGLGLPLSSLRLQDTSSLSCLQSNATDELNINALDSTWSGPVRKCNGECVVTLEGDTVEAVHAKASSIDRTVSDRAVTNLMNGNAVVSLDNIAGGLLRLSAKTDNTKQCVQLGVLSCIHHEHVRGTHEVGEHGIKLLKVSKSSFLGGDLDISLRGHLSRGGLQSSCKTVKAVCVLSRSKDACVELARDCVLSLLQIHLIEVICSSLGDTIHLERRAKNTKSGGLLLNSWLRCDWFRTKSTECSRRRGLNALIAVDQIRSARSIHAVVEGECTEQIVVGDKLIDEALCELIARVGCKGSEINHLFS